MDAAANTFCGRSRTQLSWHFVNSIRRTATEALSVLERNVFLMMIAARPPFLSFAMKYSMNMSAVSLVVIVKFCWLILFAPAPNGGFAPVVDARIDAKRWTEVWNLLNIPVRSESKARRDNRLQTLVVPVLDVGRRKDRPVLELVDARITAITSRIAMQ